MKYYDLPSPFLIWCFFSSVMLGMDRRSTHSVEEICLGPSQQQEGLGVKHKWMLLCVRPYEYRQLKMNRTGIPAL